ncbi:alanine racemase [uncultured Caballeronia sp.]|uniref:alanine racemase n=1 Tax=uncultured Caballeronia sp. TaxID=1827198 RepID=UPI0035CB7A3C
MQLTTNNPKDALENFLRAELKTHWRGLPLSHASIAVSEIGAQRWNALNGDLLSPVLVLKQNAMKHNIELMVQYCKRHNVLHAPHAKTPMSPQLAWKLIDSGSWGTTVATIDQVRVMHRFGLSRIFLANQLVEPQALRWLATELTRHPDFEFFCLVDSEHSVALMDDALKTLQIRRPLNVLIEVGVAGGRAGCRDLNGVIRTAEAIAKSEALKLVGVEIYEAMAARGNTLSEKIKGVDDALAFARESFEMLRQNDLIADSDQILSAGGSLYFDRVVRAFERYQDDPKVKIILRGGCVLTHEIGSNDDVSPLAGRSLESITLEQALELWSMVISRPEDGLAVLNFGKRDAPFDKGKPVAFAVRTIDGEIRPLAGSISIRSINDHHTVIDMDASNNTLAVGDLVGFHVAHPCTAFDKWRLVPAVDDQYIVTEGIVTFF